MRTGQENLGIDGGIQDESHGFPMKNRLSCAQHRLDNIVNKGFANFDKLVHDTTRPAPGIPQQKSDTIYKMSGAVLSSPTMRDTFPDFSTANVAKDVAKLSSSVVKHLPTASVKLKQELSDPSSQKQVGDNPYSPGMKRNVNLNLSLIDPPLLTDTRGIPSHETRQKSVSISTPPIATGRSKGDQTMAKEGRRGSKSPRSGRDKVQSGACRPQPQERDSSWCGRMTPVPAPQPWRGLGIDSPFSDNGPPRTPTRRLQYEVSVPNTPVTLPNKQNKQKKKKKKKKKQQQRRRSRDKGSMNMSAPASSPLVVRLRNASSKGNEKRIKIEVKTE
ncbi:hypothetical protein GGR50DRAFT_189106 [Xylaria sp. CBS 124048]|nr:hypothetical protein GGR50DRAFT_189106 [Xylaria sp. CBS 124048]